MQSSSQNIPISRCGCKKQFCSECDSTILVYNVDGTLDIKVADNTMKSIEHFDGADAGGSIFAFVIFIFAMFLFFRRAKSNKEPICNRVCEFIIAVLFTPFYILYVLIIGDW